jgi:cyclophilin family peptidyl-prolyl cis-trans isomerase
MQDTNRRIPSRTRSATLVALLVCCLGVACSTTDDLDSKIALAEDLREVDSQDLLSALAEGNPAQRARAALAMGRIQATGYAGPLAAATRDDNPEVRRAALFALGQLGLADGARPQGTAVSACAAATRDENPLIVADAVEALGKLVADDAAETIVPFLEHADEQVRAQAAHALFRLRFVPLWRRQADDPPPLSEHAVSALVQALADEAVVVRRAAAHAFSRYGQAEALGALVRATRDPDEWTRMFAVRAVGRSERAEASASLIAALKDPSAHVRTEAVNGLAALDGAGLIPSALAADDSMHVRAALARALADSEGERSSGVLRGLESDPSPTVASAAIESLAATLGEAYAESLAGHLTQENWTIRAAAARAARHLESGAAPILATVRDDENKAVRLRVFEVLAGFDDGHEVLAEGLRADDLAVRGTAVGLLAESERPDKLGRLMETFEASVGDDWVEVRETIVDALADLDSREEVEPVLRSIAIEDPVYSVRLRASVHLERMGAEPPETGKIVHEASEFLGRRYDADPVVLVETDKGTMRLRCLASSAPIHVGSFVDLVERGFYDGLAWHRVVSNFVIQGGDPRGDGWGGAGYLMRDEINRVPYERGAVGMPKAGKDTGGGQLFITHVPTPHLDGNYTVFARVVSGIEVVDRIEIGDRIVRARLE